MIYAAATLDAWWQPGSPKLFRDYECAYRAAVISLMAGREAEIECLGDTSGGDRYDQIEIAKARDEINYPGDGDEAWFHYLDRLRAKTRGVVRRHRDKIERVARALMKRRSLSAEEIDALLPELKQHTYS